MKPCVIVFNLGRLQTLIGNSDSSIEPPVSAAPLKLWSTFNLDNRLRFNLAGLQPALLLLNINLLVLKNACPNQGNSPKPFKNFFDEFFHVRPPPKKFGRIYCRRIFCQGES
jgi:hypothetical protein